MKKICIDSNGIFFSRTMEEMKDKIRANDQKFAFLLSTYRLIDRVRNILLDEFEQLINVRIMTFDDLFFRADTSDLMIRILLDIAIQQAITDQKIPDNHFYRSQGFKNQMQKYISLFKNHLKEPKDISAFAIGTDFEALSIVYEYYEEVKDRYDMKDRYDHYFQTMTFEDIDTVYIDGFYDFRPIEYQVLQHFSEQNIDIIILFHGESQYYEDTLQKLKTMGFEVEREREKEEPRAAVSVYECDDPYLEVKKMAIEIRKDFQQGVDYEEMAIIAQEKYLEYIRQIFADAHIPLETMIEQSVFRYKIFRDIKYLLEADNFQEWMEAFFKTDQILSFDREIFLLKQEISNLSFQKIEELKQQLDPGTVLEYREELEQIFSLYRKQQRISLIDFSVELLEREMDTGDVDYRSTLEDFIKELENIKERFSSLLKGISVKEFLLDFLAQYRMKSQTYQSHAVKIISLLDCRVFPVQNLYMVGMTDETYPSVPKEDYYYHKKNIGMLKHNDIDVLSPTEELKKQRMNFYVATRMAKKRLVFFYSLEENQKSPYLNSWESTPYTLKNFIRPTEWIDESDANKMQRYRETLRVPEKIILSPQKIYSTTSLETYQSCPRKYFYRYVLQLKTEPSEFLKLGNVLHETLRVFYQQEMREPKDPDFTFLDTILKQQFVEQELDLSDYQNELYFTFYQKKLRELIENDRAFFSMTTYRPNQFEAGFQKKLTMGQKTIHLQGKMDRIDISGDGKKRIIDYKRSENSVRSLRDFEKDKTLQFPIYSLSGDISSCVYESVDTAKTFVFYDREDTGDSFSDEYTFQVFQQEVVQKIFSYVEKIEQGLFEESAKEQQTCKYCDYQKICRVRKK